MRRPLGLLTAAGLCVLLPALTSAEDNPWTLQGDVTAMTGQYFFNGGAGAINGFGDADVQLLRNISSEAGFYIDYHGTYSGFKQVNELAGGGTLFQQSFDNVIEAKYVRRYDDGWSFKPRIAIRSELFRETTDESWGAGLYDFVRPEIGATWEHKTRLGMEIPWTWQLSFDMYYTHYPHFQSLTAQFGTEQTAPNPGARILDTVTNQFSYRNEFDLPNFISIWGLYSLSFISFTDQRVVESQGQFLSTNRSDAYQSLSFGASQRLEDIDWGTSFRPTAGIDFSISDLLSNQNDFDADPSRLKFVGAYYDYWEARLGPNISALFLKSKATVRLGLDFAARQYTGRLAQNADGSYTNNKLQQFSEGVSFDAAYPLPRGFELKTRATWSNTSANTSYEQTYQYNYHDFNYFAGVGWRF